MLLSGDVELNPGPPKKATRSNSNSVDTSCSSEPDKTNNGTNNISGMLAELLAGQKLMARDIADIKFFQQTVNKRFEALESRVAALEKTTADSRASFDHSGSGVCSLSQAVSELIKKNDDLENHSRRNNIILHGLDENDAENTNTLLSNVRQYSQRNFRFNSRRLNAVTGLAPNVKVDCALLYYVYWTSGTR